MVYTNVVTVSDTRLKSRSVRRTLAKAIERGSEVYVTKTYTTMAAGDFPIAIALHDMVFVGGYIEQVGDEGTNGTITIEKWDDVSGSTQTAISDAITLDAGAAAITAITALATGVEEVAAGYKLNAVIASCDGAVAWHLTLVFKTVDNPDD